MKTSILKFSVTGKYLYVIPMVIFGLFHLLNANAMAGMVPIPGGVFWIYLTGLSFWKGLEIDAIVPLTEIVKAHEYMERRNTSKRVLLQINNNL